MSENPIALVIAQNPVLALTDKEKFAEFLKDIKAEIDAHVPDVSTAKGRKEIGALAYKVTRSKTAIDAAGKELNASKRKEIDAVDAERREIWARLETLADEVRKPLTEWEAAEEERQIKIEADRLYIQEVKTNIGTASEGIRARWHDLSEFQPDAEVHQDAFADILSARQDGLDWLATMLDAAIKSEKDAAELAELRAEKERRDQAEAERLEKEATERAERERIAAEAQAEKDRIAQAKLDEANRQKAELEAKVQREKEEREAKEAARIQADKDAERAKAELEAREQAKQREIAEAAEAARQAEIDKAQKEQAERERIAQEAIAKANAERDEYKRQQEDAEASERAAKAEQDARDKDRKHRGEVMKSAKEAMMSLGADEETAKKIVLAIVAGEIPNTRITF